MSLRSFVQRWLDQQWQIRGWWSWLMRPLAWLYGRQVQQRKQRLIRARAAQPDVAVVVIGNLMVGGTGKTPVACALAQLLQAHGWRPGLVSRGYGRRPSTEPAVGQGPGLNWQDFGDEPALIARNTGMPVAVHANRPLAVQHLLEHFPDVNIILSDDGLQHYALNRDFEILVQDERGLGNGLLLPAGPLREPAERAQRVNLILSRNDPSSKQRPQSKSDGEVPEIAFAVVIQTFFQPQSGRRLSVDLFRQVCQSPCVAIAGIGKPERFFKQLAELGFELAQTHALADHAALPASWLAGLQAKTILMTEKDAIKLPDLNDPRIWVACAQVCWRQADAQDVLLEQLKRAGIKPSELPHGP